MSLITILLTISFTATLAVQAQDSDRPPEFPQIFTFLPTHPAQDVDPPPEFSEIPPESAQLLDEDGTPMRGYQIPQEYTPAYDCIVAFFEMQVFMEEKRRNLQKGQRLLEHGVGAQIQKSSNETKEAFSAAVLEIEEATSGVLHMPGDITNEEYNKIQIDWIQAEMEKVWGIYSRFLKQIQELGMDADALHAAIVAEGRKQTSIGVYPGPGDDPDEMIVISDEQLRPIYKKFEVPGYNNPFVE